MIPFKQYFNERFDKYVNMETFFGRIGLVEIDINDSVSKLPPDVRGIILENGDLVTGKYAHNEIGQQQDFIHIDLWYAYNSKKDNFRYGIIRNTNDYIKDYDNAVNKISVQRMGMSNKFYLAESYKPEKIESLKTDEKTEKFAGKFHKKNPDKIFIVESINKRKKSRTLDEI